MAVNRTRRQSKGEKATSFLSQKSGELLKLLNKEVFKSSNYYAFYFRRWRSETEYGLIEIFGEDSNEVKRFNDAVSFGYVTGTETQLSKHRKRAMLTAAAEIEAILSSIKEYGIPETLEVAISPQIFIAHGGQTEALTKVQIFLDILGITPLVAEEKPTEGRSVDQQVQWCLDNSDCAIILGTADDKDLKDGKLYPRRNVHIEMGRVQERFPERVIYLLEEGPSFPSNIAEKVYERFTQGNMEKAFLKVAKELKAFGVIRTKAVRRQSVRNI